MGKRLRHATVGVKVGPVQVGGGAPVVVQSMSNTDTADIKSTATQCIELARAGSDMVRITVNVPEAAAAVPEIKKRMLDAGVQAPLIGDFHYNGHVLLTKYPDCAEGARQVPHQPRQRRQGRPAGRAVRDDLPHRARQREARTHRRQRRLPQPGARHGEDAGEHRQGPRQDVRGDHQRVHGPFGPAVDRARHPVGTPQGPDHHLVQGVAAARPHRRLPRPRHTHRPAPPPRTDRGRNGHEGPRLVLLRDGRVARTRASATRSASR